MAAENVTLISDIDVLKDNFTMKLRVIRLWTLKCYWNTDELFSIEIIFMDEQGNKIQGYVPKNYIYMYTKVLKEGDAFFIKSPNLAKMDKGKFQLTDQIQKLTLNRRCVDFSGSVNGFAFVDYQTIITGTYLENMSLGHPYVDTYFDVSKFIINTDIDEISDFRKSLNQDGPNQNSSSTFTVMQSNQTSERDDFILKNELKIIADIFDPIQVHDSGACSR
uniref:Replication protein A 70 kDa DNA-binding subunit B/D first OB fold domain-containing protein n=1 Tax=Lactuca sativa TaxID=4236 RepID=A0A9R1VXE1_LACSA|nr:hypothetical protein LSAT_V11C400206130 [Lactuca sativa]